MLSALEALTGLALFRQVCDLVFEDEEVRLPVAGEPEHVAVVVFDPATKGLAGNQLQSNWALLLRELFEIGGFFVGGFRWRSFLLRRIGKRHTRILRLVFVDEKRGGKTVAVPSPSRTGPTSDAGPSTYVLG